MFHRKPVYIQLDSIRVKKDAIYVESKNSLVNKKSIVPTNNSSDEIINWLELPVKFGKEKIGYIKDVYFQEDTGKLIKIELSQGLISGAVLGKAEIKAEDIEGYSSKKQAVVLKNGAKIFEASGGAAKKAGEATSYVVHTVKKHSPKVIDSMQNQSDKIHGMFNDFKNELKKGMEE